MFFGYGKSSNNIEIPGNSQQFILTTFNYFHVIFFLRVTFWRKWFLVETAASDGQIKPEDKIAISQKALQKWEVDKLLGQNPVNLAWRLFNQSLIWFILGAIIFTLSSNFLATGDPTKTPPKTVSQIIESRYWSKEEEKLVIERASDEDFLKFLGKFKSETLAKKALSERIKVKNSKPITSLGSQNNDVASFSSSISSSE